MVACKLTIVALIVLLSLAVKIYVLLPPARFLPKCLGRYFYEKWNILIIKQPLACSGPHSTFSFDSIRAICSGVTLLARIAHLHVLELSYACIHSRPYSLLAQARGGLLLTITFTILFWRSRHHKSI